MVGMGGGASRTPFEASWAASRASMRSRQGVIGAAGALQVGRAFGPGRFFQNRGEKSFFSIGGRHGSTPLQVSSRNSMRNPARNRSTQVEKNLRTGCRALFRHSQATVISGSRRISSCSHARAKFHQRFAVVTEMPSVSAACSIVIPAK